MGINMLRNFIEKIKPHITSIVLLIIIVFSLYWQALGHNFLVYWDDNGYVTGNVAVRGVTWHNIKTAFSKFYVGNYAPVQIVSYMLDYTLWGMRPEGYIFTNILLHVANGILFYFLLVKLSWQRLPAFTAALIFLIHPVQVESVAWISQRKNVLSLWFFLVAFFCYILYRDKKGKFHQGFYLGSLCALILSLLAKSTSVIFPLVLVVFDLCFQQKDNRRIRLLDKIPFFIVAFVTAFIAMKSQSPGIGGGRASFHGGTPLTTLFTMLPVFVRYLGITFWPTHLSAVYAPPIKTGIDLDVALAATALALVVAVGIFLFYRKRDLLFWFILFFLGLLPVSQIIPLVTLMHDRYLYLPMLGASAFFSHVVFLSINKDSKRYAIVNTAVLLAFSAVLSYYLISTIQRIPVWKNEHTLWQDAVLKVPDSPKAHYMYAHILDYEGNNDEAIGEYEIGLKLSPSLFERYSLARLYQKMNLSEKAVEQLLIVLSEKPDFQDARNELALIYMNKGMADQAIEQYNLALRYQPDWAKGHNNLAVAYARKGLKDRALEHFEMAVRLNPRDPEYHYNLGSAYLEEGSRDRAFEEFQIAVQLDPTNPVLSSKFAEISGMKTRRNGAKGQ
jgi:tetratricopeptide (TPR) repeat protein